MAFTIGNRSKYIMIVLFGFLLVSLLRMDWQPMSMNFYNYTRSLQLNARVLLEPPMKAPVPSAKPFVPLTSHVILTLKDHEKELEKNCSRLYALKHKNRTCTLTLLQKYETACGYFPTQGKWTNQNRGFPLASFQPDICTLPKPGKKT